MRYNNPIINEAIEYWEQKMPYSKKYYNQKNIIGLISICDFVSQIKEVPSDLIYDFILGLAYNPNWSSEKNEKDISDFDKLVSPVFTIIKEFLQSNLFQENLIKNEITGQRRVLINIDKETKIEIPITMQELRLFMQKQNYIPLVPEDVCNIEQEFIKQTKERYKPNPKKENMDSNEEWLAACLGVYYAVTELFNPVKKLNKTAFYKEVANKYGLKSYHNFKKHYNNLADKKKGELEAKLKSPLKIETVRRTLQKFEFKGHIEAELFLKKIIEEL